jgi:hypothetical protein
MYKIGCNWSGELYHLLETGQVNVDYIKTGAFGEYDKHFGTMRSLRPVLLHGLGHYERAGMKDIDIVDFCRANRILAECGSPHYGLHLCITNADMSSSLRDEDIFQRMSDNIRLFQKNLSVPLLIENIPETPQEKVLYDHYPYAEPEKIEQVVRQCGVDMILDVTHAKITCIYKNWDVRDYLKALPLHKVKEIHINGSGHDGGGFPDDTHNAMSGEDYALLEWVLGHAKPGIISLEYVGIPSETPEEVAENLKTQLTRLSQL